MLLYMVFDPSKSDPERMYDKVEEEFPQAWIELYNKYGQDMLKVEPSEGDSAEEKAEEIEAFLSDKGLQTSINCLSEDKTIFEVVATTEGWKKSDS